MLMISLLLNLVKEVTYLERVVRAVQSGCLGCWLAFLPPPYSHTLVYYFEVVFAEFERREFSFFFKPQVLHSFIFIIPFIFFLKRQENRKEGKEGNEMW